MIVRVAERARESGALGVYVATDHRDIASAVEQAGFRALMTRADHPTGTDRVAEAAERLGLQGHAIVVNVQGDEPLVAPELIRAVAALLAEKPRAAIATACHPIQHWHELVDPNAVKVVLDRAGFARYFSRAPIPWARDAFATQAELLPEGLPCYRHIGVYAYRAEFLREFPSLAASPLERFEALEQLRALWHGYAVAVTVRQDAPVPGVDTPQDLARARAQFDRGVDKR